jgi:hypothetical protein
MEMVTRISSAEKDGSHISKEIQEPDDPSVLYWFEFKPGKNPKWVPHKIDNNSGIGNSFFVGDINKDRLPDIVISNKKGVFIFEQVR